MIRLAYPCRREIGKPRKVKEPKQAADLFLAGWDEDRISLCEQFKVCLLNRAMHVLGICDLFAGGTTSVHIDIPLVISLALLANAQSIILAHNHPSGSLKPSTADYATTKEIQKAAEVFKIKVLDHLIITPTG